MIDSNSQFFAILTAVGEAKQANATALGVPWTFTDMAVGDANGTDPIPVRTQTKLINEWRRAPVNQVRTDPASPNLIITEQVIPADVGGRWIREVGLYDADGDLVAVANCAPSFKPLLAQGTGKTQIIRMNFIVSNTAQIVLKIDPAVVLATRQYVDDFFGAVLPANKTPGTYRQVTIDKRGIVVSGTNPTTLAGNGITDAFTKPETTSAIQQAIAGLVSSSPAALDTLKELADALGNDPNFAATMTNAIAKKADKAGTLGGYGIADAYTKDEVNRLIPAPPGQATEAMKGIAKVATKGQVAELADDQTIVTPLKLAPLANKVATLEGGQVFTRPFKSNQLVISVGGEGYVPHGLGRLPELWSCYLECVEPEHGYWVGALLNIASVAPDNAYQLGVSVVPDAVNLNYRFGTQVGVFFVLDWNTKTTKITTPSKWRLIIKAWA
ncbi:phage tail protein [Pseudomonas chlororaphis]|uniref:phage tail protein n=1 Tax=Pseudomonas chlororaphis TaxID=587753 RepID=UPI00209AB72C|nr:phage tail protein [Pseudomonas chlororaphis]MCO7614676.1 phage tail protein [Pseudomonas chlororaphis]